MRLSTKNLPPIQFNYIYFGIFFAFLLLISTSSIYTNSNLGTSRGLFVLYSFGQALLETFFLVLCAWLIQKTLNRFFFYAFIGMTFVLLVVHILDFMMNRILDLSIWEVVNVFVLNESLSNFLLLLEASGIPHWGWVCIFAALASVPLLGIYLYKTTALLTQRKPFSLRAEWLLQSFICIPCAFFVWDYNASKILRPDTYTSLIKSLPWKLTLIPPKHAFLNVASVREPLEETALSQAIEENPVVLAHKPNIYLFVIESLRDDFIDPETAPHLTQFKESIPRFDLTLSNANGTHLSWFSIFHSQFPYCWKRIQEGGWKMGSPALTQLKKWGYQIRLYSAAHLAYYGMEDLIFGKDLHLADSHQFFPHVAPVQAWEADSSALAKMQKDIRDNPELEQGQLFIIFWDGTHFDYSWPKNSLPKFTPFAKDFAYFKAFNTANNVRLIQNRYRNAVHQMDRLFGDFLEHLPRKDEAIVVLTGDHGEEFYDEGHLFHGSQLSHAQTNIPLFFKFGRGERTIPNLKLASQMDIFPSILHYLSGNPVSYLGGQSIFEKDKWSFVFTARFNAGLAPYEFSLNNGRNKVIAQFTNRRDLFKANALQILSLRSCKGRSAAECQGEVEDWLQQEFGAAFNRLFPNEN